MAGRMTVDKKTGSNVFVDDAEARQTFVAVTPTWRGVLPMLLAALAQNPYDEKLHGIATAELERMASIADSAKDRAEGSDVKYEALLQSFCDLHAAVIQAVQEGVTAGSLRKLKKAQDAATLALAGTAELLKDPRRG